MPNHSENTKMFTSSIGAYFVHQCSYSQFFIGNFVFCPLWVKWVFKDGSMLDLICQKDIPHVTNRPLMSNIIITNLKELLDYRNHYFVSLAESKMENSCKDNWMLSVLLS